ncbi:YoxF protein [Bacillus sp. JCM 19046]|nr:YoxF protein [Bacillus sp. JCM 19045]GAF19746.1 YoxF protein [Bacillus sp. JCM 19046]
MRYYELYLVTDDVATSYSGKESKLFQLFEERDRASRDQRLVYDRQIDYITKILPEEMLKTVFDRTKTARDEEGYVIHSPVVDVNSCTVEIQQRKICLKAQGDLSAETDVFDLLKSVDSHFFAVNVEDRRFGWLKPYERQSVL